jgi:phospholipid/cholesterol/gamma-HCH transport system substrate-binding protein
MDSKREQAFVGLFVLVVAALLIGTLFVLSGTFSGSDTPFRTYFKNAGGLGPGAEVRYAGGPPIGRIKSVIVDPNDPTRMQVDFTVHPDIPVKTDSSVLITSTSPLGENFLGIKAGSATAPRAPKNYVLKSAEPVSFSDIAGAINDLTPQANQLLANLNSRVVELKETLNRVNDLLNEKNRDNVSASLNHLRGMLQEDRPLVHSTLENVNDATTKLKPLIDKFSAATDNANKTLDHIDAVIGENRADIRRAVIDLRQTLANANSAVAQLNGTIGDNAENIDEIIENLRITTENLNSFTETLKTRPYTLLRDSSPKPHKPGSPMPK